MSSLSEQAQNLLALIPETGSIGNVTLRKRFAEDWVAKKGTQIYNFDESKAELLAAGLIKLGRGKGGSVRRVELAVGIIGDTLPATAEHLKFIREVAGVSPVTEQVEYHANGVPATLPLHSGSVLRVVENPVTEQIQTEEEF